VLAAVGAVAFAGTAASTISADSTVALSAVFLDVMVGSYLSTLFYDGIQ
jgi:hypothetical protein